MKNWVISRPKEVNPCQCFIFLGKECSPLRNTLTYEKMTNLINAMIDQVRLCLSHAKIPKNFRPGKNSRWYSPKLTEPHKYPRKSFSRFWTTKMKF